MKTLHNLYTILLTCIFIIVLFVCCDNAPQMPKPSTYLRLEVEKPDYIIFEDNNFPFSFEYPSNATIEKLDSKDKNSKWFNLNFEKYNFVANVSYLPLNTDSSLRNSVNDCYNFLKRHEKLSGGIVGQEYFDDDKRIYANIFEIKGRDVVSPMQYYITDSLHHFVRVSLNSNFAPNNDSCEVVINQLKSDLIHIIQTFQWK